MRHILSLSMLAMVLPLSAQHDLPVLSIQQEEIIESYVRQYDPVSDHDHTGHIEQLEFLRQTPIDINTASANELAVLPYLTQHQIQVLIQYRLQYGRLIDVHELQALEGFDPKLLRQILPFITAGETASALPGNWKQDGRHQIILRYATFVQQKKGFRIPPEDSTASRYPGHPASLYFRYRYAFGNRLSIGLTAEKDAGEEFFTGSNRQGFDFLSAHGYYANPQGKIKAAALGDFSISMGQGLIIFNGFSPGKSYLTTTVKKTGRVLRPYTSANESGYFRGAGISVGFGRSITLTAFGSNTRIDANVSPAEAGMMNSITSIQTSGKHRTTDEITDEKSVSLKSTGLRAGFDNGRFSLAWNTLYSHLSLPLFTKNDLYNKYRFSGNDLINSSLDYSYTFHNYHFFGETAMNDNHAPAFINGLLISLDPKADIALVHRYYHKSYRALFANPFGETSGAGNETGLYLGLAIRPATNWQVNAYFDSWRHPWLRFRVNGPSQGREWLLRISYHVRRKLDLYVQVREQVKMENHQSTDGRYDQPRDRRNLQGRVHLGYHLNKGLEWRTRFYAGFSQIADKRLEGTVLLQDLIYRPVGSPWSFSTRIALFDTDDYAIRFYAYENNLLGAFSIPAYNDRGTRFYLNLRWRGIHGVTVEGRYARTYYAGADSIADGLEEIEGPVRSEIKMQIRWVF